MKFYKLITNETILFQGKYMDIELDHKGDPIGGVITTCKLYNTIIYYFHKTLLCEKC